MNAQEKPKITKLHEFHFTSDPVAVRKLDAEIVRKIVRS